MPSNRTPATIDLQWFAEAAVAPTLAQPGPVSSAPATTQGGSELTTAQVGPAWTAQLPKDLSSNEKLTRFATIGDMGKAFLELEGKSASAIVPPGDGASEEARASFYEKLGRPKTAEEYELAREVPAGLVADPVYEAAFKKAAFESGLSKAQAKDLFAKVAGQQTAAIVKGMAEAKTQAEAELAKLKADWGSAYDANVQAAQRAFKQLGSQDFAQFMDTSGLGNNPAMLRAFHSIWGKIGDDRFVDGKRPDSGRPLDLARVLYPNQA